VVHLAAAAVVAADSAMRAAVRHMKPSTTVTAAKEPCEKGFNTADRATTHEALPVGVVGDQALIPLELGPVNVALVVVLDQSFPFVALASESAHDPLAASLDRDATARAAEGLGAGVDGVGQVWWIVL